MSTPTWEDFKARNVAATSFNVSGLLRVMGDSDTGPVDNHFVFWYGRGDRWWVERNGDVVYASSSSTDSVPVARRSGQMVHQRISSLVRLGALFTPRDLFGPLSLLTRRTRVQHVAKKPEAVTRNGRPTWSTVLTSSTGLNTVIAIDDQTGVIVELSSPDHDQSLHLDDFLEHDQLSDDQFEWNGPVIEAHESRSFGMSW